MNTTSEFRTVFSNDTLNRNFLKFLEVVFHLFPEKKFHSLIEESCKAKQSDADIYKLTQSGLPGIKPFLSEITYALPALKKQKKEMSRQTLELLNGRRKFNGYLEIGSTGRYISDLRRHIEVGKIYLMNDIAPNNGLGDIFERGQIRKIGVFANLDYEPIPTSFIPDGGVELITIFIGLHHCPPEKLEAFMKSVRRCLATGGMLIIRDHDVKTKEMGEFVSLVHTVFNLGLNVSWETNELESKSFKSIDEWCKYVETFGFRDSGKRLLQQGDPSDNTLVALTKI
jgi:hypothetical protein